MGMCNSCSQQSLAKRSNPVPSFPIKIATGGRKFVSKREDPLAGVAAQTSYPCFLSSGRAIFSKKGTVKREPADARTTFELKKETVFGLVTRLNIPVARAVRRRVPKLPGSCKRSRYSTQGVRPGQSQRGFGKKPTTPCGEPTLESRSSSLLEMQNLVRERRRRTWIRGSSGLEKRRSSIGC